MTTFEEHQAKLNADNNLHDSNILNKYKIASGNYQMTFFFFFFFKKIT